MSRTPDRDPDPPRAQANDLSRPSQTRDTTPTRSAPDRERSSRTEAWSPTARLTLPSTPARQPVALDDTRVSLRASEANLLATVGAFRVVAERDLADRDAFAADLRSLRDQDLVDTRTVVINGSQERVLALTECGHELLERNRTDADKEDEHDVGPMFSAGFDKPRELAHDAQLYRLFLTERDALEAEGATLTDVALDAELKRDYHSFVEERIRAGADRDEARREYAEDHDLPFANGHVLLPDLRIEYETADGRHEHRDLELATENYSRSQLAGKQAAGFRVYRAHGSNAKRGGTPVDPHHLERL